MLRNLEVVASTEPWSELLDWVNRSMPEEAPNGNKTPMMRKVEDCGRGIPYVLMLPSMLPIIHTPLLTSRVKVPAKTDFEAVANLKVMHDALRRNGINIPDVLATNSQRLVDRSFQANLQLLQWFRGLSIALQQCGIEAGEGRIILEAPSNEDSISSFGSPPASVVHAGNRRRLESLNRAKPVEAVRQEVRVADAPGDAAAAAAAALLSEHRSLSQHRSQSRPSLFDSTVLTSTRLEPYPVHQQQQMPAMPRQAVRHESASRPRRETQASTDLVQTTAPPASPPPAQPLVGYRQSMVKQVTKPAALSPQPQRIVEHPPSPTGRQSARVSSRAPAAPPAVAEAAPAVAPATIREAPRRRSSPLSRRPSGNVNGGRMPNHTEGFTPDTPARTPTTGRISGVVFKALPARLSASANPTRRPSSKTGATPREASSPRTTGSRRATPKRSTKGAVATAQPFAGRRPRAGSKPIIALSAVPPPPTPTSGKRTPRYTEVVPVVAAAAAAVPKPPPAAAAPEAASPVVASSPNASAADVDVAQLQIDRQFYYDKLRAIEELINCMEAKKRQEQQRKAASGWDAKDAEMMDFTQSVRHVLYAES